MAILAGPPRYGWILIAFPGFVSTTDEAINESGINERNIFTEGSDEFLSSSCMEKDIYIYIYIRVFLASKNISRCVSGMRVNSDSKENPEERERERFIRLEIPTFFSLNAHSHRGDGKKISDRPTSASTDHPSPPRIGIRFIATSRRNYA